MTSLPSPEIARLLPDLPRWVELRGMLLAGHGYVLGPPTRGTEPALVAMQSDTRLAAVAGRPPVELIAVAAQSASEILAVPENEEWTAAALPGWSREVATLHALTAPNAVAAETARGIRELNAAELEAAPDIPGELREELLDEATSGNRVVAAFLEGRPVAFCYAGAITEGWWDISIDTLEPFRRQGHAGRCVAHLIGEMMRAGKRPVWGAMASNVASARLALKLGFTPVDRLVVFSRR